MFTVSKHVWRTTDGRLVEDGDPAAAFLAYPAGTSMSDAEAKRVGLTKLNVKAQEKPDDKARARPSDKAGGLRINRLTTEETQ